MKAVAIVLLFAATAFALRPKWHQLTSDYSFEQYKADFSKRYSGAEHATRKALFDAKLKEVMAFNADKSQSWKKGINHMSDWTEVERARIRGTIPRPGPSKAPRTHVSSGAALPNSVDWRTAFPPILTTVKDQGQCGSCWAHASTESIESAWAIKKGELFVLSQQQITSCTPNPNQCGGTGGCGGNIAEQAFEYVTGAGGITQEWSYSYQSYTGNTPACNVTGQQFPVKISGYTAVTSNDVGAVLDAVASAGPLAISVDASSWPDYEGGIFTGCDYAKNISMDHAVQLVGYGHDFTTGYDFYLVRNSWSAAWGEDGFIRLIRHKTPQCGWNVDNQNGYGCKNGPTQIWVCGTCGIASDALYVNVDE